MARAKEFSCSVEQQDERHHDESAQAPSHHHSNIVSPLSHKEMLRRSGLRNSRGDQFDLLPEEVWAEIFTYLEYQELCYVARVSKAWNRVSCDDHIWHSLFEIDFQPATSSQLTDVAKEKTTWKKLYKTEYRNRLAPKYEAVPRSPKKISPFFHVVAMAVAVFALLFLNHLAPFFGEHLTLISTTLLVLFILNAIFTSVILGDGPTFGRARYNSAYGTLYFNLLRVILLPISLLCIVISSMILYKNYFKQEGVSFSDLIAGVPSEQMANLSAVLTVLHILSFFRSFHLGGVSRRHSVLSIIAIFVFLRSPIRWARSGIRSVSILLSFISPLPRMLRTSSSLFLLVVDFVILFIYAKAIIARGNFLSLGTLAAAVEPMYTLYLFISFYIIRRRIL